MNPFTLIQPLIDPPVSHWIWLIPAFLIGGCIGSFLNVVIYRVPLGLSINEPKRSFCPSCKKPIPMALNLPMISWLWLRGRCRECGVKISFRYFAVEFLTAVLFTVAWSLFAPDALQVVLFLWVVISLWVAIAMIDAEHLIIPIRMTWAGSAIGLLACAAWPQLPALGGEAGNFWHGLRGGAIGWASGFFGLWLVVELGKLAFGRRRFSFDEPVDWSLQEATDDQQPIHFVLNEESISWWDIFSRKSDCLKIETTDLLLDEKSCGDGLLEIREHAITLPNGTQHRIEDIRSLSGRTRSVVIPREAMGMGDIHLLGMIGAFTGWMGVIFTIFAASIYAIISAIIGRIGFGKQLPFGPFLVLGALTWLFGGWEIWQWYLNLLGPMAPP